MKKVLFTVALMFGAMVASAQVSVVKEAKALKKDPAAAAKVLEAALTNPETAKDPETWKLAGDLQKAIYDEENMKMYLPGGQADMPKMYGAMLKMFEYYLKCDEVEQAGVANGTVKKAKHRKKNAEVLLNVRGNLANGGVEAFNENKPIIHNMQIFKNVFLIFLVFLINIPVQKLLYSYHLDNF